ncbi:hypothetical protein NKG94_16860 [Micromonospora sp. M12]
MPIADVDITSPEYPNYNDPGNPSSNKPAGTPGQFTINAKGNKDIVGFYVGIDNDAPTRYIAANAPGGTATITMTPTRSGPGVVSVRTWDGVNPSTSLDSDFSFFATSPVCTRAGAMPTPTATATSSVEPLPGTSASTSATAPGTSSTASNAP